MDYKEITCHFHNVSMLYLMNQLFTLEDSYNATVTVLSPAEEVPTRNKVVLEVLEEVDGNDEQEVG